MSRTRLPIASHLTHGDIARRYRTCRHAVEKTHWQALWLLTGPDAPPPTRVAELVGLSAGWVRALIKRWNAEGPAGLVDRRAGASGGQAKLTPGQQAELSAALQAPPPDGGLWTGPKLAAYARQRFGVTVCKQTGWEWLRRLGFTPQVPRPAHPEAATPAARRAWKRRPGRAGRRPTAGAPR
jgi:transposase